MLVPTIDGAGLHGRRYPTVVVVQLVEFVVFAGGLMVGERIGASTIAVG